jgi:hypothetical protein
VLVVTPHSEVAGWAAPPIAIGPGATLEPLVVGPDGIPVVSDPAVAAGDPELAVLSAMAHGGEEAETAARIAFAGLTASLGLEDERALLYSDLIRTSLSDAARKALEALMATPQGYEFQSEFARKHDAIGQAKGVVLGQVKARAEAVISFLEARGIPLSGEQRERILACADLELLARWIRKAATISSADELFEQA